MLSAHVGNVVAFDAVEDARMHALSGVEGSILAFKAQFLGEITAGLGSFGGIADPFRSALSGEGGRVFFG